MKRLKRWTNIKISETGNSCGIYISNDKIKQFIESAGYKEYLNADEYISDVNGNSKGVLSKGFGCYTKQKIMEDTKIENPMIFYAEAHVFKKVGRVQYTSIVLFFQEETKDHSSFKIDSPILVKEIDGGLSSARSYIGNAILNIHWATNGCFENLDEAIQSLEEDMI